MAQARGLSKGMEYIVRSAAGFREARATPTFVRKPPGRLVARTDKDEDRVFLDLRSPPGPTHKSAPGVRAAWMISTRKDSE
mmetsp:Transcript_20665/g.30794  ORF Transcript_20665/g.30794 Transcript_20665/m.30794 type:complete len:81 (-) Transcript_20665:35-277(-)